jgi:hypothetical protein
VAQIIAPYPNNAQSAFVDCPVYEVLFAGGRGGGKTIGLIFKWIKHASTYREDAVGLIIRRRYTQLKEIMRLCAKLLTPLGGRYNSQNKSWTFPVGPMKGAVLHLAHLWSANDAENYQGWSITFLGIEELTNWPDPEPISRLYGSMRSGAGVKSQVCLTGNPGGPGHCTRLGEVLTPNGWKNIKDFKVGDPVYTVLKTGEMVESKVSQVHAEWYSGDLYQIVSRGFFLECTPGHNVAQISRKTGKIFFRSLNKLHNTVRILRSVHWNGEYPGSTFKVPCYQTNRRKKSKQPEEIKIDQFFRLLGWFLSEGSTSLRDSSVRISQCKEHFRNDIKQLLDDCGFKYSIDKDGFAIYGYDWCTYFSQFGKQYYRFIPEWVKNSNKDLLNLLFLDMMKGDGHRKTKNSGVYFTTSKRLSDDFTEVAIKLGYTVFQSEPEIRHHPIRGQPYYQNSTVYQVHFKKKSNVTILSVNNRETKRNITESIPYSGMVYCIGVENTHSFVIRQNGCTWVSGNSWVKSKYIDPAPNGYKIITDPVTQLDRVFIPSLLDDNLALQINDPTYEARLKSLGNAELVKAWRYGIWTINVKSYFADVWVPSKQILPQFKIPETWDLLRSFDWGSAAPASLGLTAISDGNYIKELGRALPKGSLVRFNEKYYAARDQSNKVIANVGVKMKNRDLGQDINRVTGDVSLDLSVADPSIFAGAPGESIYDQMTVDCPALWFTGPPTRDRVSGWMVIRSLLEESMAEVAEAPGLWVMENCTDGFIRTVGSVQMDEKNFDDIDTTGEDHVMDEVRYGAVTALAGMVEVRKSKWS